MGRVKLEIKRIENSVNRQISFTKRRDGLMKKAFELSVLCGVDVAVITFSPTGKLRIFSGNNKSIEEVIERCLNIPDYGGRRLENQEYLRKTVCHNLKAAQANNIVDLLADQPASPDLRRNMSKSDYQVQELQQEIIAFKDQLEAMEKRLRFFESDPSEITTLSEAQIRECVLKETLKHVSLRKRTLEMENNHLQAINVISQVQIPLYHDLISNNNSSGGTLMDWHSPRLETNGQNNMNFLNPPNLIPLRNQQLMSLDNTQLQSQPTFFYEQPNAPQFRQNMEFNPSIWPEFDTTEFLHEESHGVVADMLDISLNSRWQMWNTPLRS
ncbi:agamous-like MADS-box protein AGL104 [Impatiens glandulifera]|uniref:agamous-like MADS-box protein AGL104 n=1 Tax=Impatiens glandulifera TaxID=253017 RepID=UPI001FB14691|nr:agamous-like MADS-box protein AGL104 [Impatiens glandulifera]